MSNLSDYVDSAARRVTEFDEDPRMAVSVVVDDALAADQREVVLERVQEQVTVPVADGGSSALDTDIEDIGVGEGESWTEAAERLDETPDWDLGVGAVLYNDRPDAPEDRRDLWHVTTRLVDHDGSDHFYVLWDGTHTRRRFVRIEDVLADFAPAGWCWPTGRKPLYHLTRNCGVDDPDDLMTDGGSITAPTCGTENCDTVCPGLDDGWEQHDGTLRCADCWSYQERHGHWPDEDVKICVECRLDQGKVKHDCEESFADYVIVDEGGECPICDNAIEGGEQ
ncbi:hypothetical protein [Haloarcula sp. CBA1127]|uniref:hypothetical protein n=1 Tax=Haloarcula sp. CBA1127 TaxID=1765055 RepID=UPI00073F8A7F|nr:hypothetical protein [Haloarcula sp. CBA1127]